jgi:hypothetical protein
VEYLNNMSKEPSTLLGKILVGIKQLSNHIFALLRYGRINVIAVVVIYFALWYFPQGQDILVGMPEEHMRVISSFVLVFAMALLNWYFPRLFYPANDYLFDSLGNFLKSVFRLRPSDPIQERMTQTRGISADQPGTKRMLEVNPYKVQAKEPPEKTSKESEAGTRGIWDPDVPEPGSRTEKQEQLLSQLWTRMLGILTFLILSGGLLHIYLKYNLKIEYSFLSFWLSIGMLLLAYLISFGLNKMQSWLSDKHRWLYSMVGLFILIGVLGIFGKNTEIGLLILSISFFLGALLFGIFVTCRTKIPYTFFSDWAMAGISFWVVSISFSSFVALNFFPSVDFVFPLNALLQGLIFYIGLASLIVFWGKSKQTYFLSLFILFFVALSMIWKTNLHEISTTELEVQLPQEERITFEEYLVKWLSRRGITPADSNEVDSLSDDRYPLFIVTGEGGGSRAAYWTNLTLGALHEATDGRFQDHCLAITTVSGSSFGTAVHLAQLYQERTEALPSDLSFNQAVIEAGTFEGNYLSTSLVNFMGTDFWRTIVPPLYHLSNKNDRAYALEQEWTKEVQKALERMGASKNVASFYRPYLSHYYSREGNIRTDLPLYLPNTTHVGSGNRSLVSPVKIFDQTDHSTEIFEFGWMNDKDLPLAAAALLSARFPYINPGGFIPPDDQFVDGGYFENIGGVTARELIDKVEAHLKAKNLEDQVEIHLVSIFNSKRDSIPIPVTQKDNEGRAPQVLVPINTLAATPFSGHTDYWPAYFTGRLTNRYHKIFLDHELEVQIEKEPRKVIMPLARYLSKSAGLAIQANVVELEKKEVFQNLVSLSN